jgi:hypothetical protein
MISWFTSLCFFHIQLCVLLRHGAVQDEAAVAAAVATAGHCRPDDDAGHSGAVSAAEDGRGGKVRINRSTHHVKPFYLSSETVPPIKGNRSTYQLKPFYLSNRSSFQTQLVPLRRGGRPNAEGGRVRSLDLLRHARDSTLESPHQRHDQGCDYIPRPHELQH